MTPDPIRREALVPDVTVTDRKASGPVSPTLRADVPVAEQRRRIDYMMSKVRREWASIPDSARDDSTGPHYRGKLAALVELQISIAPKPREQARAQSDGDMPR